jgi:hypothetical protein
MRWAHGPDDLRPGQLITKRQKLEILRNYAVTGSIRTAVETLFPHECENKKGRIYRSVTQFCVSRDLHRMRELEKYLQQHTL